MMAGYKTQIFSRLFVIFLLAVSLSAGSLPFPAFAPAPAARAQVASPGEAIPLELLLGTLGGAAGGTLGFFGTFALCMASGEDPTGWGSLICAILGIYGYGVGVPLGATLGVTLTGHAMGVQGSVFLSALGAVLGFGAGVLALAAVGELTQGDDPLVLATALTVTPFLSALGATLGYNVEARVRAPEPESAPSP